MIDIVDTQTRSRMMSGIRSRNTKPEIIVRKFLHANGFRYRLHDKKLPGRPDIVLLKYNLAIFVHGCFWHRHTGCRLVSQPNQNQQKWEEKFKQNIDRDKKHIATLSSAGWRILIIWECGLRKANPGLLWLPEFVKGHQKLTEWPCINGEKEAEAPFLI
ncbi:very short patch repair endonuclease [Methylophilus sp. VKM B-3414]|uniref:very short patch repair endonuclease n=1 Tax=Methylophilus sp. VKM B-3414 TaxID=3076121 RepID=UPI0028C51A2B|nr:very short patch repair endonuclease [Methylophilus sp. VKM B-3414]MDT7848748.1 very short patch repair endonuclease [Methylophilus sp. VKM B-3414]